MVADVPAFAGILMLQASLLLRVSLLFLASLLSFVSLSGVPVSNTGVTAVPAVAVVSADLGVPLVTDVQTFAFIFC